MKLQFRPAPRPANIDPTDWLDWQWQMRHSLKSEADFARSFALTESERQGLQASAVFQIRSTPYYAALADTQNPHDPLRRILMPTGHELTSESRQSMLDPLAERRHQPAPRLIHRYPDRVLFLVTDFCSVYCRYCTRKHFTGGEQALVRNSEYAEALRYLQRSTGVREVILSGGDPLTLTDSILQRILTDLRNIEHLEIIRIGSRMPVVDPMRITPELAMLLRRHQPVFVMTHFNHPRELTSEAAQALANLVDHGVPVFNQMVLLNGVNNHAAIVQALSRRLLYLRVKPYYMFQCDPSEGSDHLRTSIEESMLIQRELWGNLSGLAMPSLSLDIPDGGGKVGLVPDFEVARGASVREYVGWDGVHSQYIDPDPKHKLLPADVGEYLQEWQELKAAKSPRPTMESCIKIQ